MKFILSILLAFVTLVTAEEKSASSDASVHQMVGQLKVPIGMKMRSLNKGAANYLAGGYSVLISQIPQSKMKTITYIWAENSSRSLRDIVSGTKVLPFEVFKAVSEEDAIRMVANLKMLGCEASYKKAK